jgi:hypothetical protein
MKSKEINGISRWRFCVAPMMECECLQQNSFAII